MDLQESPQARYYDDIFTCSIVTVSMIPGGDTRIEMIPDDMSYARAVDFHNNTLVMYSYKAHGGCDYKLNIEQVADELMEMLSKPEYI